MLFPFGPLGNSSRRESLRMLDGLQLPYLCLFMVLKALMTTGNSVTWQKVSATVLRTGGGCRTRSYSPAKPAPWNVDNSRFPI